MKNAIIVEDEPKGRENLRNILRTHCPEIQVIAEAGSNHEFLDLIQTKKMRPDVVFLDIDLPDGLVFESLKQLRPLSFQIIFITAYNHFTEKACWFASMGYITKPIDSEKLVDAVQWVRKLPVNDEQLQNFQDAYNNPEAHDRITVNSNNTIELIEVADILRIEADDNYSHIYLSSGKKHTSAKTLKKFEEMLSNQGFYRVHKGHIINMDYMGKFIRSEGGQVEMKDGTRVSVSRRRRPAFMEYIKRMSGNGGPSASTKPIILS